MMKNICKSSAFIYLILFSVACREPLVSSADEKKEELIQGSWLFQSDGGTISLLFKPDLTVDILVDNSAGVEEFTFHFRIETGDLYFLTFVGNGQEVEFVYKIERLTSAELVLSFINNNGIHIIQSYSRL